MTRRAAGVAAVVVAIGCGRIGYEATADDDAGAGSDGGRAYDSATALARRVLCHIDLEGGPRHLTVFEIVNRTAGPFEIPVGVDNRFIPVPADRGQPRMYPPGASLFGLLHDEARLVWRVGLGTATTDRPISTCRLMDGARPAAVLDDGRAVPLATP